MRRTTCIAACLAAFLAGAPGASAAPTERDPLFDGPAHLAKISRQLLEHGAPDSLDGRAAAPPSLPTLDIRLTTLDDEIVERARAAGLTVIDADYSNARLYGYCPPEHLTALAAMPEITAIHPNYGATSWGTGVVNQADQSIRADLARETFGVDGGGVRVGILSDSFNSRVTGGGAISGEGCDRTLTGSKGQTNRDLPESLVLIEDRRSGSDEGRAMAELIHDLAPGADLLFHTAFPTMSVFSRGIEALADCGSDVIVDDVIFFAEPMFQDGIIAQSANRAVDGGVPFFSAIGNLATFGVDESFRDFAEEDDVEELPSGNDLHLFANGSRFASIEVPSNCGLRFVLQWNEPFSGILGPGASSDLDLYACSSPNPLACATSSASRQPQGCSIGDGTAPGGDPIEILRMSNPRSEIFLAVEHVCGNEDLRFRIAIFSIGCNFPDQFVFDPEVFHASQAYGHPMGRGVVSVGAVFYEEIDSAGAHHEPDDVINVEPFSSLGGEIPIYFDDVGNWLADGPEIRSGPQISAPDGTNTSFFGVRDIEDDGFRNFFGTSAAAPHAAAVAALMLDRLPDQSPAALLSVLEDTSIDIESPGHDDLSGAGLIDAVDALAGLPTSTPEPTATATETASATATATLPPATATPSPTLPAPTVRPISCAGDCDGNGVVAITDLIRAVRITLGLSAATICRAVDGNGDGIVTVAEIVVAVGHAIRGCPT